MNDQGQAKRPNMLRRAISSALKADAGMKSDRLAAFSDGVFSIAITLLVLSLAVPGTTTSFLSGTQELNVPQSQFAHGLGHEWPTYLAFGVSFATIGVIWINHSWMFGHVPLVNRIVLFLNLVVMITVVSIPFTTAVMTSYLRSTAGDHATQHAAAWLYVGSLLTMSLAFLGLWRYLDWQQLFNDRNRGTTWQVAVGPIIYLIAGGFAFWNATVSLILCLIVAAFYVYPVGELANS